MNDLRPALVKLYEKLGVPSPLANEVVYHMLKKNVEPVFTHLSKSVAVDEPKAPPSLSVVAETPTPQPKKPWDPYENIRPDAGSIVPGNTWVLFTIIRFSTKEAMHYLDGECEINGRECSVNDTFNKLIYDGRMCLDSLIKAVGAGTQDDFIGKQAYALYVDKGKPVRKIAEYMSVEEYNKRDHTAQM